MIIKITNICVSFNCLCKLNLKEIFQSNYLNFALRYNPKNFPGLRLRLLNSKTTSLIFSTGHVSIVGCRSISNCLEAVSEVKSILKRFNYNPQSCNYKIINICGATELKPIDLIKLTKTYPTLSSYEPELFPAVKFIYRNKIFTVHHTGKIFSTGYRTESHMINTFKNFCDIVRDFQKENSNGSAQTEKPL
jgi:TATA-box binding protein (TBP) (component of TFIID and TFIIIB)